MHSKLGMPTCCSDCALKLCCLPSRKFTLYHMMHPVLTHTAAIDRDEPSTGCCGLGPSQSANSIRSDFCSDVYHEVPCRNATSVGAKGDGTVSLAVAQAGRDVQRFADCQALLRPPRQQPLQQHRSLQASQALRSRPHAGTMVWHQLMLPLERPGTGQEGQGQFHKVPTEMHGSMNSAPICSHLSGYRLGTAPGTQ